MQTGNPLLDFVYTHLDTQHSIAHSLAECTEKNRMMQWKCILNRHRDRMDSFTCLCTRAVYPFIRCLRSILPRYIPIYLQSIYTNIIMRLTETIEKFTI